MSFVLLALKYWKYLAGAMVVLAIVWWHMNAVHSAYSEGVRVTRADWAASQIREAEESRKEVEQAKAEAQAERVKAASERKASEDRERLRQEEATVARDKLNHDYESRLRAELAKGTECAAWSKQLVVCPIR